MAANAIRMARLTSPSGSIRMVPMDHGISMGPLTGISPISDTLDKVAEHATCLTVHKGLIGQAAAYADKMGILMHLSASTDLAPDPNEKRMVATVHEAARLGADGVSTHLNLGSLKEADQIEAVGAVSTACHELGMPHIAMVYPRGPSIDDPLRPDLVAHAARLGAELGADAVKVPFTGAADTFAPAAAGAGVPVIIAGGPKRGSMAEFLADVAAAKQAGASGVSVGRNVFQADDPAAITHEIAQIFQ